MYYSKLPVSKRFLVSVMRNILSILSCSVSLMFTALLRNQARCIFQKLLSCWHLYVICWLSCDILSLTRSLSKIVRFESSYGWGQLNFLLYRPERPYILHNQNNNKLISLIFQYYLYSFRLEWNTEKNKNLVHLTLLNHKDVTCVDIIAQVSLPRWSTFLLLDLPTWKLKIILNILPTNQPKLILLTACTTNN